MDGTSSIGASHRPLRDRVVDELRRRIIDGVYEPGDRLTVSGNRLLTGLMDSLHGRLQWVYR